MIGLRASGNKNFAVDNRGRHKFDRPRIAWNCGVISRVVPQNWSESSRPGLSRNRFVGIDIGCGRSFDGSTVTGRVQRPHNCIGDIPARALPSYTYNAARISEAMRRGRGRGPSVQSAKPVGVGEVVGFYNVADARDIKVVISFGSGLAGEECRRASGPVLGFFEVSCSTNPIKHCTMEPAVGVVAVLQAYSLGFEVSIVQLT